MNIDTNPIRFPDIRPKDQNLERRNSFRSRIVRAISASLQSGEGPSSKEPVFPVSERAAPILKDAFNGGDTSVDVSEGSEGLSNLVNIFCRNIEASRPIIMVSDNVALTQRFKNFICDLGLGDLLLSFQGKEKAEELLAEIVRGRELAEPIEVAENSDSEGIEKAAKDKISSYRSMLSSTIPGSSKKFYEMAADYLDLETAGIGTPLSGALEHSLRNLSEADLKDLLATCKEIDAIKGENTSFADLASLALLGLEVEGGKIAEAQAQAQRLEAALKELQESFKAVASKLGIQPDINDEHLEQVLQILTVIDEIFSDNGRWLDSFKLEKASWISFSRVLLASLNAGVDIAEELRKLPASTNLSLITKTDFEDLETELRKFTARGAISRLFETQGKAALERAREIEGDSGLSPEQALLRLTAWKNLHSHLVVYKNGEAVFNTCFEPLLNKGRANSFDLLESLKLQSFGKAIIEILNLANNNPNFKRLIELFRNPSAVYENDVGIGELKEKFLAYRTLKVDFLGSLKQSNPKISSRLEQLNLRGQQELLAGLARIGSVPVSQLPKVKELVKRLEKQGLHELVQYPDSSRLTALVRQAWYKGKLQASLDQHNVDMQNDASLGILSASLAQRQKAALSRVAKRHFDLLPNVECGGIAGSIFSHSTDSKMAIQALFMSNPEVLFRIKPVIMIPSSLLQLFNENLGESFYTLIVDKACADQASNHLSQVGLNARQLIVMTNAGRKAEVGLTSKNSLEDSFADYLKVLIEKEGLVAQRNAQINGEQVELVVRESSVDGPIVAAIRTDGPAFASMDKRIESLILSDERLAHSGIPVIRTWIAEWVDDKNSAEQELLGKLKELESHKASSKEGIADYGKVAVLGRRSGTEGLKELSQTYRRADIDGKEVQKLYKMGFIESELGTWGDILEKIIKSEGPIHRDILEARLKELCGLIRTTPRLEEILSKASVKATISRKIKFDGQFYSSSGSPAPVPRNRKQVNLQTEIGKIPPQEVEAAALGVITKSCGIHVFDLIEEVAKLLGISPESVGLDSAVQDIVLRLKYDAKIHCGSDGFTTLNLAYQ